MRGREEVGEDTSNRHHLMFICDQETRTQFLSNPVPASALSNSSVTVCLFKNAATHLSFARLTFCSISWCNYLHMVSNLPRSCPYGRQKKADPVLIKGTWSSPNTQFPGTWRIQYSVIAFSRMPTESQRKPRWHPEVCGGVIYWCPGPAACAFHSTFLGKEGSVISKLGLWLWLSELPAACWAC